MPDIEYALSALAKEIQIKPVPSSSFTASVISVSDDHSTIRVKLCTGTSLDVPTSLLKNLGHLGTASQENERWGLASGEIDVSTHSGILVQQMAHEINRLCQLLQATRERSSREHGTEANSLSVQGPLGEKSRPKFDPSDTPLPPQTVKMAFQGVAGTPITVRYDTPPTQYIGVPYVGHSTWSVSNFNNCFFRQPPLLNDPFGFNTWIEFFCDAAQGTPITQPYTASFWLTVELVQRTT